MRSSKRGVGWTRRSTKSWTGIALAALMLSGPLDAVAPVRIIFNRQEVVTSAPVVGFPGGLLVPLRPVNRALGGQVVWDRATKTAVARYRGRRLEVDDRAHSLQLDGQPLPAPVVPRTARDRLLVPLAAVERLFGVRGRWQPRRRLLSFTVAAGESGPTGGGNASNPAAAGVALLLGSDHQSYPVGTPVLLTLSVTNRGRAPVTLQFATSQKYDFVARRSDQTIWRWAADRMFTQVLTSLTLAPGERKAFTVPWNQSDAAGHQVPAGEYQVAGTLTTMTRPQPQSPPLTLRIGS